MRNRAMIWITEKTVENKKDSAAPAFVSLRGKALPIQKNSVNSMCKMPLWKKGRGYMPLDSTVEKE